MKTVRLVKFFFGYKDQENNSDEMWVLSLPFGDGAVDFVKEILTNPTSRGGGGNNFDIVVMENNPNKIIIYDSLGNRENPLHIIIDRQVMLNLVDQWLILKKQEADEIIIEQHDNGKFSVRGVFYPKSADA
jgi:hypothetical protein